jgi:hypothetical protein
MPQSVNPIGLFHDLDLVQQSGFELFESFIMKLFKPTPEVEPRGWTAKRGC